MIVPEELITVVADQPKLIDLIVCLVSAMRRRLSNFCRNIHYPLVNLHRSSLDRTLRSFRECPSSLEVSAIWNKSRHLKLSRKPWRILSCMIFYNRMPSLSILHDKESRFSKWTISLYSVFLRHLASFVERFRKSSSSLISLLSHGYQVWNAHSKWGRMNVPYNLWKSACVEYIIDAFLALVIALIAEAFGCCGEEVTQCMIHLPVHRCREDWGAITTTRLVIG